MSAVATTPAGWPVDEQPRRRRSRFSWGTPFAYFIALVVVGVSIVPILYVFLSGFRTTADLNSDPTGLPHPWTLDNYVSVLTGGTFWRDLLNSGIAAVSTTAGVCVLGISAAFVIARYTFKGRQAMYTFFTLGLLFPVSVASIPLYLLLQQFNLLDSLVGVIIPQIAFQLPTTIIILVPFLRAIPQELEDAAFIDGASRVGFFWRILLPLSGPGLVTVGVLAFVASWNSFLLPLLVLNDQNSLTLPLGVRDFSTQYSTDTAAVLAYTSLAILPALIFFTLAERRIVGGLQGAVKG